jgi:uncharacterized protein (TIGR02147 family)
VAYNNAGAIHDKQRFFERMASIKVSSKEGSLPQLVRKEHYRYFSQWYHPVVRSLIHLYGFSGDYKTLARTVRPQISPAQAKKSVALLENLGFIRIKDGGYSVVDTIITSAPEVTSLAIHNFHTQTAEMARKALSDVPRDRRNFTGVTLGMSATSFKQVCKELEDFRTRLLELANNDANDDDEHGVYQINLQMFPVSQSSMLKG